VAIILIVGLAVVALAFGAAKVLPSHHPHTPNPVAPLVGAVDRAKATVGAANAQTHQEENLAGGDTTTTSPLSP
jgi:hypothetical protein